MTEMILLKLGELVLKGANRYTFEDKLKSNLARRLKSHGKFRVYSRQSTTYIEPLSDECDRLRRGQEGLRRGGCQPGQGLRQDQGGYAGDGTDLSGRQSGGGKDL